MESESIPDPNVGVYFIWPRKRCLFVWPCNPMGHNEYVVSAWGVFVTSHIGSRRNFLELYKYELLSTKYMRFKTVRAPWARNGQYLHGWAKSVRYF